MDLSFTVLSLCAGIAGLDRAIKLSIPTARTVCFIEHEAYAIEVLLSHMEDKALDEAPVHTDLRTFNGSRYRGLVDCVIGGIPCQPISVAGKQKGSEDPRWLWPDTLRIVSEVQPTYVFFENPPNLLRLGFRGIGEGLREMGYRVAAGLYQASEVGAPHKRERLFFLGCHESVILAHSDSQRRQQESSSPSSHEGEDGRREEGTNEFTGSVENVADSTSQQHDRFRCHTQGDTTPEPREPTDFRYPPGQDDLQSWAALLSVHPDRAPALPKVCRESDGLRAELDPVALEEAMRYRTDRLRALGNSVVPECASLAFLDLLEGLDE